MGNTSTKHQGGSRPKKYVHWKSAEVPSPPGKPQLSHATPEAIVLQWARPQSDGGAPILGYLVEHRRTGAADWIRYTLSLVPSTEMILSGLPPGWRYQFRVSAENVVGRSRPSELSDQLTVTLQRNIPFNPPQFVDELQDMVAVENEKVEFRVCVNGVPTPQINWFKDGFEIFSSRRTKIVNEPGTSLLIIHQAALMDEGEIKCTATNRMGYATSKAQLVLEAPPKIRLPRQYEDGLLVEAGEMIRLKVGIAGRPAPDVMWKHNGTIIVNEGRFELETNDKNSSLKIVKTEREDRGEYHLRAYNKLGDDIASFLVTVTSKPSPPGRPHITMSLGKSVTLNWAMPNDDGGCKIGNYIVEYYRIGWNVWLKSVATRQLTATISDLIEGSEYKFRVKAENPYGLSEPSSHSEVLIIPDSRQPKPAPRRHHREGSVHSSRGSLADEKIKTSTATGTTDGPSGRFKQKSPRPSINIQLTPQILDSETNIREMTYGAPSNLLLYVPGTKASREPNVEFKPQSILKKTQANEQPPPPLPPKHRIDDVNKETTPHKAERAETENRGNNKNGEQGETKNVPVASAKKMTTGILRKQSVLSDGDQTDDVHTSGEFMLVLYPKDEEKINEKQTSYDLDMEDAIPPPMSLSAPDLRSDVEIFVPLHRRYASSTELLYERAMARFYQAVQFEETENARQRSVSVEPRIRRLSSFSESERRPSMDRPKLVSRNTNQIMSPHHPMEVQTSIDESVESYDMSEPVNNNQSKLSHPPMEMQPSSESEASYVSEPVEIQRSPMQGNRPFTPTISVDYDDDYTASTASSDDSLEKFKSLVMAHNFKSLDETELETYHPQSMEPRALSPYRQPEPDQSSVPLTRPFPPPSPDFIPKPILKRPSVELDTNVIFPVTIPPPKSPAPAKPERKSLVRSPEQSMVNIEQIEVAPVIVERIPTVTSLAQEVIEVEEKQEAELTEAQKRRLAEERRKLQQRQSSIEETKVIVDHYSDIVNTLGKAPIMPKVPIYLNTEALRKAAEEAEREEILRGELNKYASEPEETVELNELPRMSERKITKRNEIPLADRAPLYKGPLSEAQRQSIDIVESQEVIELKQRLSQRKQSNSINATTSFEVDDKPANGNLMTEETRGRSTDPKPVGPQRRKPSATRSRSNSAMRKQLSAAGAASGQLPDQPAVVRPPSRTRNPSKTRKRDPSMQRARTPLLNATEIERPQTPQEQQQQMQEDADTKVRSTLNYFTDIAMFLFACWLYFFKDARLAIPVLILMLYRQLGNYVRSKMPKWLMKRLSKSRQVNEADADAPQLE